MRDVFIVLMVLSTIPMIFLRPHVGILAWCWISYMSPHRLGWGFAYEFPFAMIVALATMIAWALSKDPKRLEMTPISALLLFFVFWMTFANFFAMEPELALDKWKQSFKILLMTFITMALVVQRERLHAMIWVIVLSLAFFGIKGGVFTILTGGSNRVWGPTGTFIEDNNALAMALLMVIPLIRHLELHTEQKLIRIGLLGTNILMAFSILGSLSRGAFLGSIAMMIFLTWKSSKRLYIGAGMVVLLIVSLAFVPQEWVDRMKTIENYQEDTSAMQRLESWEFGLKLALDRPLVGGGFRVAYNPDNFTRYMPNSFLAEGQNFHSVYFEILGELGFAGLAIYLALLIAAWRSGSKTIAMTQDRPDYAWANSLARMTQVSLVGFISAGAFQNLAFFDLYFHLLAILFAVHVIVRRELQEAGTAEVSATRNRFTPPWRARAGSSRRMKLRSKDTLTSGR